MRMIAIRGVGTISADVDGDAVTAEVWTSYHAPAIDTYWVTGTSDSAAASDLGINVVSPAVGTFDCTISVGGALTLIAPLANRSFDVIRGDDI